MDRRAVLAALLTVGATGLVALLSAAAPPVSAPVEEGYEALAARVSGVQSGGQAGCPSAALLAADGAVLLQPQGTRLAGGMREYVDEMARLLREGVGCATVPEVVREGGAAQIPLREFSQPYASTPINKEADYEFTRVFAETRRGGARMAAGEVDATAAMAARALDTHGVVPSSQAAVARAALTALGAGDSVAKADDEPDAPSTQAFYRAMEGRAVAPPDPVARQAAEAALLAMYRPRGVAEDEALSAAAPPSVQDLADAAYADEPDWRPVVKQTGPSRWEVTELVPSARAVARAEADPTRPLTLEQAQRRGLLPAASVRVEAEVPGGVAGRRVASGDPYFDKSGVVDPSADAFWRWGDFQRWTPGLERMFAPTQDTTEWS